MSVIKARLARRTHSPPPSAMPSITDTEIAAYLRVAAYAIAMFDFLQSVPAEIRLYRRQKGLFSLSVACTLFILVRYLGVITMVMSGVGFFYNGFTPAITSQSILALRTYAVSRRSPTILRALIVLFVCCAVGEFISTFWKRLPFQHNGNCTGGNLPGVKVASLFYVGCLVFDVVAMAITGVYLWKFSNNSRASLSRLAQMMVEDGIMYFVALTAMNITNLIFFENASSTLQSSASSLGFAVTMIFSSRFILNLSERSRDGVSGDQSHSSRTPVSGNRRGANHTLGTTSEIVVNVKKNVITMHDMVPGQDGDDSESARQVNLKGGEWTREDGSMA
ncbi:hypothetical protein C8R46DRAFT_647535 [Mycena filopes]|nr:hypothetical protein C8R46DRAFT_647535 [Mycena filopes]